MQALNMIYGNIRHVFDERAPRTDCTIYSTNIFANALGTVRDQYACMRNLVYVTYLCMYVVALPCYVYSVYIHDQCMYTDIYVNVIRAA